LLLRTPRTKKATIGDASFAIVVELLALVAVGTIFASTSWISVAITGAVEFSGAVIL